MAPPRPPLQTGGSLVAATFLAFVFVATLLVAASWSVRSEARGSEPSRLRSGFSYSLDHGHELSFALIAGESSVHMGTGAGWDDFEKLRDDYDQDLLWFSVRGRRFLVLEAKLVERARDLLEPIGELGARQGRLGEQQAKLGAQQAEIGARQARLGARQAALSQRLATLALEGAEDSEQRAVERSLEGMSRRMEELTRAHEPLAREQGELGRRQSELGRRMERLAQRVSDGMRRLAEEAIDQGHARPLRD